MTDYVTFKDSLDFTMDIAGLNEPQRKAVTYTKGPLLVLAGAGSGKTRVITTRIAWLIQQGVAPAKICAVTFTNKAAREMKERLRQLTGGRHKGLVLGTFHALGLRLLKENHEAAGLTENFVILGSDDQLALATDLQREFMLDPQVIPDKTIIWIFSQAKNSGYPVEKISSLLQNKLGNPWGDLFARYQQLLFFHNAVDFDDLILRPRDLLSRYPEIRLKYHQRWQYFLADEFQDTNPLQFDLLKQLICEPYHLCAVGDDDQSIYGWRGADIRIILDFQKYFPQAEIVYLEQNYRSTQTVLDLANHTIRHNPGRHNKRLWSAKGYGDKAVVYQAADSEAEAVYIADTIFYLHQAEKIPLHEIAILFRTNFQSRPLEEEFRRRSLPYHLSGSYQFFDRKEIKDVISYLRFCANHKDDKSLSRIINFPKRNIGESTLQKIQHYAKLEKKHLWDVIEEIEATPINLTASQLAALLEFRDFIKKHSSELRRPGHLAQSTTKMLEELKLEAEFARTGLEENKIQHKLMNIRELVNSIHYFETGKKSLPGMPEGERGLFAFLQYLTLLTGSDDEPEGEQNKIQMMTLHMAKGLEFRVVFLAGLEEGLLPHRKTLEAPPDNAVAEITAAHSVEEERRLFYVGLTRAKEKLFLTNTRSRRSYGTEIICEPSRFLQELPGELLLYTGEGSTASNEESFSFDDMLAMFSHPQIIANSQDP